MKRILIQNKSQSISALDSLRDLVAWDIEESGLEIEATYCLSETEREITDYSLIICHPHIENQCCIPYVKKANEKKIPIILTYSTRTEETERLEAMSTQLKINLKQSEFGIHNFYSDLIRSLEGKF
jgi:hypothetical protein